MSGWLALADEIAHWRDAGRDAELWWRDDDAADATPALERLLALKVETAVPLALAVVPALATPDLAARLDGLSAVDVMQHGYSHTNHAPPTDKKCELGPHRPAMLVLGELGTGRMALERLFGARPLPVLVPPWNVTPPSRAFTVTSTPLNTCVASPYFDESVTVLRIWPARFGATSKSPGMA